MQPVYQILNKKVGLDKLYLTRSKNAKSKENECPLAREVSPETQPESSSEPNERNNQTPLCKLTRDLLVTHLPQAFKKIDSDLGKRGEKSRNAVFAKFLDLESLITQTYQNCED